MRWVVVAALVVSCGVGLADEPAADAPKDANRDQKRIEKKNIKELIQGHWSRIDHPFRFVIKGERWEEFNGERPLLLNNYGKIEFGINKPYAFIHANGGQKLYLFPISRDIMAVETILGDGKMYGDGRIFYRGDIPKIKFD